MSGHTGVNRPPFAGQPVQDAAAAVQVRSTVRPGQWHQEYLDTPTHPDLGSTLRKGTVFAIGKGTVFDCTGQQNLCQRPSQFTSATSSRVLIGVVRGIVPGPGTGPGSGLQGSRPHTVKTLHSQSSGRPPDPGGWHCRQRAVPDMEGSGL